MLLAIDTALGQLNIALQKTESDIKVINIKEPNQQSKFLAHKVDTLLKDNCLSISDISSIIVNKGPGSFTGIRIGVSFAQGLSVANNIKVLFTSTFCILENTATEGLVTINAGINKFYCQEFQEGEYYGLPFMASKESLNSYDKNPIYGHFINKDIQVDPRKMINLLCGNLSPKNCISIDADPYYIRESYY